MTDTPKTDPANPMPMQGEGDYIGGRRYQEAQTKFAHSGKVEKKAREAEEALDGPGGPELKAAAREGLAGDPVKGKTPPA